MGSTSAGSLADCHLIGQIDCRLSRRDEIVIGTTGATVDATGRAYQAQQQTTSSRFAEDQMMGPRKPLYSYNQDQ